MDKHGLEAGGEMSASPLLSLIVPVYHGARHLAEWRAALEPVMARYGEDVEVILVDDGSQDGSWEVIAQWASEDPRFRCFGLSRNFGQHAAMTAGFERARGRIVMTVDDDLQIPLDVIPEFVRAIEAGSDIVAGHRLHRQDPFVLRRIPSAILNFVFTRVTGSRRRDFGCNHVAYRAWVIRAILSCPDRSRFTPELVAWVGGTMSEVAVPHRAGPSRYRLSKLMRLNLLLLTRYTFWPLYLLAMTAGAALILLAVLPAALVEPWVGSAWRLHTLSAGLLLVVIGLVSNSIERLHDEATGRPLYVIHPGRVRDRRVAP